LIAFIARLQWLHLRSGLLFWLLLGLGQLLIAWLAFAQFETFAEIAPRLKAAGSNLGATELVIVPTLNSVVLLLLIVVPLLAMGSLAAESRSGRLDIWLSSPVHGYQVIVGKALGIWLASLPILLAALVTLALLGLGIAVDWRLYALAAAGLVVLALWLSCICLLFSAMLDHPAAALAASLGTLVFLWLLDSIGAADAAWHRAALLPHVRPWLDGLLRSQDIAYFGATGAATLVLATYLFDRRRGIL
jgi:ABC-2 type transport system permease protein